jgi:rhodanese-related sulfurtransferase
MKALSVNELNAWLADANAQAPLLLDVREPWEVERAAMPEAVHIPMNQVVARFGEVDVGRPVVCICHHGARSLQVALYLEKQGIADVYNLSGGINAWSTLIDPSVARY